MHCPALCATPGPADHPVTGQSRDPGILLGSHVGGGLGEVPAASEPMLIMRSWPHLVGRSGLTHPPSISQLRLEVKGRQSAGMRTQKQALRVHLSPKELIGGNGCCLEGSAGFSWVGGRRGSWESPCRAPGVVWQPPSPHPPRDLQTCWPWATGTHVAALGSCLSLAPGDLGQLFSNPHL